MGPFAPSSEYGSFRRARCEYGLSPLSPPSMRSWIQAFVWELPIFAGSIQDFVGGHPPAIRPHGPRDAPENETMRRQSARRPVIAHNPIGEFACGKYTNRRIEPTSTLTYYVVSPPLISRAMASFVVAPIGYFSRSAASLLPKNLDPFSRYSIFPARIGRLRMVPTSTFSPAPHLASILWMVVGRHNRRYVLLS